MQEICQSGSEGGAKSYFVPTPYPLLVGGLLETVHQLTQVVASIAKSCPEHYANISFFARRLCLADLGKIIKS